MSRRFAVHGLCFLFFLILHTFTGLSLPRYSLISGTRCSVCHYDPQGGGMRNDLGWEAMRSTGAFDPRSIGINTPFGDASNGYFDGLITTGVDVRYQGAVLLASSQAKYFFMQLSPYVAITPVNELTLHGSYNFIESVYPGQTDYSVAAIYQPGITLPSIKVGFIQPTIGIRHDDHTMFTRLDSKTHQPVIPPFYNEWGGEVMYEGQPWMSASFGVFAAHNLSKVEPTVNPDKPSFAARIMLWPQLFLGETETKDTAAPSLPVDDLFGSDTTAVSTPADSSTQPKPAAPGFDSPSSILRFNGELGASVMKNEDFVAINAFAGIGLADVGTLYGEYFTTQNANERKINNYMIMATVQPWSWLAFVGRYEHGTTQAVGKQAFSTKSIVAGAEFFPIPFFEIRPEIRYLNGDTFGSLTQLAVQLHLFY